jgi:hypothetical protein
MAIKKRLDKRREPLTHDARAWLEGRPCGFWEFRDHAGLVKLWQAHGDTSVATWDGSERTKPEAVRPAQ